MTPTVEPIEPQLATLARALPSRGGPEEWVFEIKYDGFRAIAYLESSKGSVKQVSLVSRNGLSLASRFPSIVEALRRSPIDDAVLDGEVCAIDERGRARFESLQTALRERSRHLVYFVFDLLALDGRDLRSLPLVERKVILERIIPATSGGVIRRSQHQLGDGTAFLDAARALDLEGVIAKRAHAPYRAGRSTDWLKIKLEHREELVIVGYTPPRGTRQRFGALLLATRAGPGLPLRYAGKVGTGLGALALEEIHRKLVALEVERPQLAGAPREKGARWVAPRLVAEVRFTEWTSDGKLRHPSFLGLREDKSAEDVHRES